MAITLAQILAFANQKTARAETDITDFLRDCIHDLELELVVLETETDITTTSGTANYSLATLKPNYRRPISVWPKDSSSNLHGELTEISYEEYKERLVWRSSSSRPKEFAIYNDVLYVWPAPNATYTKLVVVSPEDHGDTVSTIRYPEKFRSLLKNGTAYYLLSRYGQGGGALGIELKTAYELEKMKFVGAKNRERPLRAAYNDL